MAAPAAPTRVGPSRRTPPAAVLVATGAVSVQCGAAVATSLFPRVGATGAVTVRLVLAAVILLVTVRPRADDLRRWSSLGVAVAFGLVLAGMNLAFYEAIARVPLGVGVTVEFAGPLAVTILGSRRRSDLLWALLAGTGVFLLAGGGLLGPGAGRLDLVGVGAGLAAGAGWAGYILLSAATGRRFPGASGLTVAMVVAAVAILPVGVATAGGHLVEPRVLGLGLTVAVLSSALPYSLELAALRRVSPRAFGILVSMDPGVAALAGLAVLGQHLTLTELVALLLVVAANAGSSWFDARAGTPTDERATGGGPG